MDDMTCYQQLLEDIENALDRFSKCRVIPTPEGPHRRIPASGRQLMAEASRTDVAHLIEIAREVGLHGRDRSIFTQYMIRAFPHGDPQYWREWAQRFKDGKA